MKKVKIFFKETLLGSKQLLTFGGASIFYFIIFYIACLKVTLIIGPHLPTSILWVFFGLMIILNMSIFKLTVQFLNRFTDSKETVKFEFKNPEMQSTLPPKIKSTNGEDHDTSVNMDSK